VEPVTRGTRLAAFFWVQSMVREPAKRQLLFELDRTINTLTRSKADAAALMRLAGIYHNLLRQWAES
jgi:PKHD-type hydroxylase